MRIGTKSDAISRSSSLKVPKEPQSMLILNDFVAHKPPKPKRNSVRTQSMRNRARPAWNKYNVDASATQAPRVKSTEAEDYAGKPRAEVRVARNDTDTKPESAAEALHSSKRIEQLLQSSSYSLQPADDSDPKTKFYSLQTDAPIRALATTLADPWTTMASTRTTPPIGAAI